MKRVLNQTAAMDLRAALRHETTSTIDGFIDPETARLLHAY